MSYDEAVLERKPAKIRKPLTPISPNRRAKVDIPFDVVSRNITSRLTMPSLSLLQNVGDGRLSLFSIDSHGREQPDGARSDQWWMLNFFDVLVNRANLVNGLKRARSCRARKYPAEEQFDGKEDWDTTAVTGVDLEEMLLLLDGIEDDFCLFLTAEGQLCRLMLSVADHMGRCLLFKAWIVLVGRFCGWDAVQRAYCNLQALERVSLHWGSCTGPSRTMFDAASEFTGTMIATSAKWKVNYALVDQVRDDYFGDHANDVVICAMHGWDCCGFMEDAPVEWSSSDDGLEE